MKKSDITYEQLSKEIKDEVESYYRKNHRRFSETRIEDAISDWFETEFDAWLIHRFTKEMAKGSNNRKYFRIKIEIPIYVYETLIESSKEDTRGTELIGTVINISKGGLFFNSPQMIDISSIIKVKLDLSAIDSNLGDVEALAMVVHVEKMANNQFGIGLMFSSIYDENRQTLETFIFKNLSYYIYAP